MLEGKTGFLGPGADEDALAPRMAELLEDPRQTARMAQQAVRWSRID